MTTREDGEVENTYQLLTDDEILRNFAEMAQPRNETDAVVTVVLQLALFRILFRRFRDDDGIFDFVTTLYHELSLPGLQNLQSGCP
jgi:hypothetical protein